MEEALEKKAVVMQAKMRKRNLQGMLRDWWWHYVANVKERAKTKRDELEAAVPHYKQERERIE